MSFIIYISLILYYLFLIISVLSVVVFGYFQFIFYYWKRKGIHYLEPSFPFGNIRSCFDGTTHVSCMFKDIYKEVKGPFAGIYYLYKPALFIKDPQLLKHILVKDFNNFVDRGVYCDGENDPLSVHLFRVSGTKWRELRYKISSTFTSCKLKTMFPLVVTCGIQLQKSLEAKDFHEINIQDVCARYVADVISSVAFGIETNSFETSGQMYQFTAGMNQHSKSYFGAALTILSLLVPAISKLFKFQVLDKKFAKILLDILHNVVQYRENNMVVRNDFLQLMIQLKNAKHNNNQNSHFTFKEFAAQVYIFIVAGFETSTVAMTLCLYELAKNRDIQKKIQEEIDDVLEKYNGDYSYDSINSMKYLDMVVCETLRKYPPLGFLNRITNAKYTLPNSNVTIEKGIPIVISILGLHYDPKYFPKPENFDPERFSPENKDNITPFTYLPFGDGPRNCIGMRFGKMQTKTGLVMLLHQFNVELCQNTPKTITWSNETIITLPKCELKLLVTKRKKTIVDF